MFFRTIVIIMKKKTSPQQNFIVMKGKKKCDASDEVRCQ